MVRAKKSMLEKAVVSLSQDTDKYAMDTMEIKKTLCKWTLCK